ncbi:glutamyl-tRNA reductase [Spongorhabdus nitratireducens]
MGFLALGINHKTAPVELRERVSFTPDQTPKALNSLLQLEGVSEAAILSTCNRTEMYCAGDQLLHSHLFEWLANWHELPLDEVSLHGYVHGHEESIVHMMRVACGLDSMILGEPQILGQLKSAYAVAVDAGTTRTELGRLFQASFSAAKRVRSQTAIGENPVSVAFAAVSLAKQIFSDLSHNKALLIGAGETIELVARHLHEQGVRDIMVANRTLDRARRLAEQFDATPMLLADIPEHLAQADIIISSTASQLPILGKGAVERALKKRKHQPVFMVDIAVPRDIEPEVAELPDVYLYSVDDLREVIEDNMKSRQQAAEKAETLILEHTEQLLRQLRSLAAVDVLKALREQAELLRDHELARAMRQLNAGMPAEDALKMLARGLTNKLIHTPTVQLRHAGADGRTELISGARELYALTSTSEGKPQENRPGRIASIVAPCEENS